MARKPQHEHLRKKLPFLLSSWQHLAGILPLSQWLCRKSCVDISRQWRFFKISFWCKYPLPSTLRRPRKLLYQYSRAIWSTLEVLNAIFCILVQALSRKFEEVIEDKCTKAYYLFSVFLQTNQMWRLMWSSGFHFCLLSSPVNDLPFFRLGFKR